MDDIVWIGEDVESQIKELEAEMGYYENHARECRARASELILEAMRSGLSAKSRRGKILQLRRLGMLMKEASGVKEDDNQTGD